MTDQIIGQMTAQLLYKNIPQAEDIARIIDWADFTQPMLDRWDYLGKNAATPNVFYEHWCALASRGLPEGRGVQFMIVTDFMGDLLGILPVQTRKKFGMNMGLENWDQRVRASGEPLILSGAEERFWQSILVMLDKGDTLMLRLSTLRAHSPSTLALMDIASAQKRDCHISRKHARAVLFTGPSSKEYRAANIRSKVQKEHRRQRSRMADMGALTIDKLPANGDIMGWINDLFDLEQSGWKGRQGVATNMDPHSNAAFREVLNAAHERGNLDFQRMAINDIPVSMLATIESAQGEAFQLKIAFDESRAALSPGVLLEMAYLDNMLDERRLSMADSCARPGHPMIDRIWTDRLEIISLVIGIKGWRSGGAMIMMKSYQRAKAKIRRML